MENGLIIERLEKLRMLMEQERIDAYIIVSDDFHGSEYVGDYFKCREFISGFDGSAGTVVVMKDKAGLWTDGRYFIQAAKQLEGTGITLYKQGVKDVPDIISFLDSELTQGQCVGYDGRTIKASFANKLGQQLNKKHITINSHNDLVGKIWYNRPEFPHNNIWSLDVEYCGKSMEQKIGELREELIKNEVDGILLASLDDISWLFNIRGNDIDYTPVVMSYAYIDKAQVILYACQDAMDDNTFNRLNRAGVIIKPYLNVYEDVRNYDASMKLMVDESSVNISLLSSINDGVHIVKNANPTQLAKAIKNSTELDNERKAHLKDAVAVTKLICKLKTELKDDIAVNNLTELQVSKILLELRKEQQDFVMESFASIIATGEHGAIVHYEPTERTDVPIENDSFLLMDTGGHYLQGTTDITRTVAIGNVSEKMKNHYTAVLKGNLNLGAAYFKEGVTGENLDYLARSPLWEMGLDYNHGTGHGVGYLMNVHEGPNGIRLRNANGKQGVALCEGMITSNEPGLYIEGQYGIRLENLVACVKGELTEYGQFMKFETLTKVPFDIDAINTDMLDERQRQLLNEYHREVYNALQSFMTDSERVWLKDACAEI